MPSSITYLAIPSPKALRTSIDVLRLRLDRLRRTRLLSRSRKQRNARNTLINAAARAAQPASAVLHRISRLLRPLFKAHRSPAAVRGSATVARLLGTIKAGVMRSKAFAAIGTAVRGVLKRLRALLPTKLRASLSFLTHAKHRRRRALRWMFHSAAVAAALVARIRRRRLGRALAPLVAAATITTLMEQSVVALAARILADRAQAHKRRCLAIIQQAWTAWKARRQDRLHRKQQFMSLLSTAHERLLLAEAQSRLVGSVVSRSAAAALTAISLELARRRGALLIQRVWRGSRARARVYAILSGKKRKAYLRLQRERVRRARAALLSGTPQDVAYQKMIAMRVAARQKQTTPPRDARFLRGEMARCRPSVLEHIPLHKPPRVSAATGARVLQVSFQKFEKIRQRHARVNPSNLYVAIPVAYDEGHAQARSRGQFMTTTFDWVPATLLSTSQE